MAYRYLDGRPRAGKVSGAAAFVLFAQAHVRARMRSQCAHSPSRRGHFGGGLDRVHGALSEPAEHAWW